MRLTWASPLLLLAVVAAGCGSSHRVSVTASPGVSRLDEPVEVVVHGLSPGTAATVRLTSVDAGGTTWSASARFRADRHGTIDLARTPALSGYPGTWQMGLTAMLEPSRELLDRSYRWSAAHSQTFRLAVVSRERVVARTSYRRHGVGSRIVLDSARVATDGFAGSYVAPVGRPRGAVLLFGGSEGGLSSYLTDTADLLAAHGIAALAVGYFGPPGTPPTLSRIPLEYFVRAIAWLRARSGVRGRVTVMGTSYGSEAALLLGAHFPALVGRVVAVVPSSVVSPAYPGGFASAWTLRGKELPFETAPRPDDPAAIPVERIRGPLMTICAGADDVWPSCPSAHSIARRRRRSGVAAHDLSLTAAGADHVDTAMLVPDLPGLVPRLTLLDPVEGERDREKIWPQLLRFLGATP